jgi:hypothetical protein
MRGGEGSIIGIWMHGNHVKNGNAQLVNKDVTILGSIHANNSFVLYSCAWTSSEETYVLNSIQKI